MSSWEIDRSRILSYQACPRKRYLEYHFLGSGIQKKSKSLPLQFGAAFHEGVEVLLAGGGAMAGSSLWNPEILVDDAVEVARRYLADAFAESGVDLEEPQTEYAVEEQKAIAEGLIRGWWAYDGERFLRDFEVIEVEQEGRAELARILGRHCDCWIYNWIPEVSGPGHHAECMTHSESTPIVLMFRPDALVRERMSGDLYVVSWKTCSTFGQRTLNQCAVDTQSMSEVWGVEQRLAAEGQKRIDEKYGPNPSGHPCWVSQKIEGVLYLFAVKGQRRKDDYLGIMRQTTPLAYGWRRRGPTPEEDEWSWKYEFETEEINSKTGKPVKTRLGKGWQLVPIWSEYPGSIKEWIADLAAQRIAPRHLNALEAAFPQSLPVSRRADEIESWRRQIVGQEERIRNSLRKVELVEQTGDDVREAIDVSFPHSTHSCFAYNSKCQFYEICHQPATAADPMLTGLYKIRTSNHPEKGGEDE